MAVKLGTHHMYIGRVRKSCSPARLAAQPNIPADAGPDTLIELVMVPVRDRSSATVLVGGP